MRHIKIFFATALVLGGATLTDTAFAQSIPCHTYTQGPPALQGFGVAYDVFNPTVTLLKAFCDGTNVSFVVGAGNSEQFIYEKGYTWDGIGWQPFTLLSANPKQNQWVVGQGSVIKQIPLGQIGKPQYFVNFLCTWTGAEWKCGCSDQTCAVQNWQLQAYVPIGGISSGGTTSGGSTSEGTSGGSGIGNSSSGGGDGNATPEEAKDIISASRYKQIVTKLSSDEFEGREVNTQGGEKTIQYIMSWFGDIGLLPAIDGSYRQRYQSIASNVIGYLPGNDPQVGHEVVIITAHHDGLGKNGCVYHGAVDNSSGTAAVIELAHALYAMRNTIKRTVIFMTTDGEETPRCTGSSHYVFDDPVFPIKDHVYNLNIDMVGGFKGSGKSSLQIHKSSSEGLASAATAMRCNVDSEVFEAAGIRATTVDGDSSHYHTCSDTVENMNFTKAMNGVYHSFNIAIREIQK